MVIFLLMLLKSALCSQHCAQPIAGRSWDRSAGGKEAESFPPCYVKELTKYELRAWREVRNRGNHRLIFNPSLLFGPAPVYNTLHRYFQIRNPTNKPVLVQPFLLIDPSTVEDVTDHNCCSLAEESLDDEEFTSAGYAQCTAEEEEAEGFAGARSALPFPPSSFPGQYSLPQKISYFLFPSVPNPPQLPSSRTCQLPKYKCSGTCVWTIPDSSPHYPMLVNQSQAFFLGEGARSLVQLPPNSVTRLGPIVFQPQAIGNFDGWLYLRNNLTVLEKVALSGEGTFARLAFQRETIFRNRSSYRSNVKFSKLEEFCTLSFNITKEDIIDQLLTIDGQKRLPPQVSFTRMFEAQNVGSSSLHISKILLDGYSCSLHGVTIANCEDAKEIPPKAMLELNITYDASFVETDLHLTLWVIAEESISYVPLEVALQLSNLSLLEEWRSVRRHSGIAVLSEAMLLVQTIVAAGCLVAIGRDALLVPVRPSSIRSNRSHWRISFRSPVPKPLHSPLLQAVSPLSPEPESQQSPLTDFVLPPPAEPVKSDPIRTRKVKKTKASVLKFAPTATVAEPSQSETILFAGSRLMLNKVKKKGESRSVEEGNGGTGNFESFATTITEEELDDVYLDDYKTRGLFSGFSAHRPIFH